MASEGTKTAGLDVDMTGGKASYAKAAEGDKPVFDTDLKPVPPVTPIAMGKATRGIEVASLDDIDEAQFTSWFEQAATMPFETAQQRRRKGG